MAKVQTRFVCQACGAHYQKWVGRCTECSAWNTVVEETVHAQPKGVTMTRAIPIAQVHADQFARVPTGIGEFDRILGGGAVLGGVTLIGGDPGIGKSTLLLQALAGLASRKLKVLYVSGEESAGQTADRARRLGAQNDDRLLLLADTQIESIEAALDEHRPSALVVDSIQTMRCGGLDSAAGTIAQLREVTARIIERSKRDNIATFLVGHVTKDGTLAGPKVLEHLVDTVLAFEGERGHALRTLRAQKNRFGSAIEVGVFEMRAEGLREVDSPSTLFLAERPRGAPGSVVAATAEGARALLVEVQALVGSTASGSPRRNANGVESSRLAMLLAVLERRGGLILGPYDVFLNVAGGIRIEEPALDLAVALALASSFGGKPLPDDVVVFGEIGLAGEVRGASRAAQRLAEAAAMGFKRAIAPPSAVAEGKAKADIEVVAVRTLSEALDLFN